MKKYIFLISTFFVSRLHIQAPGKFYALSCFKRRLMLAKRAQGLWSRDMLKIPVHEIVLLEPSIRMHSVHLFGLHGNNPLSLPCSAWVEHFLTNLSGHRQHHCLLLHLEASLNARHCMWILISCLLWVFGRYFITKSNWLTWPFAVLFSVTF